MLYTLYTAPLIKVIEDLGVKCHIYADDIQLFYVFTNLSTATSTLENCVTSIQSWMCKNFLKLNPDKTEILLIQSKYKLNPLPNIILNLNGEQITSVNHIRSLGVNLDSCLTMKNFVSAKCKKIGMFLRKFSKVRKYFSFEAANVMLNAFVLGQLDYCNTLLIGSFNYLIDRLQRLQNWSIRILFKLSKFDHVSFYYTEVHWLPVKQRINFKVLLLVFKCIIGEAPAYLSNLLTPYHPNRTLRSSDQSLLLVPHFNNLYGSRAFSVSGPILWNALPDFVKNSPTAFTFKKRLKTYIFRQSF